MIAAVLTLLTLSGAATPLAPSPATPSVLAQRHASKASPFDGLRWKGNQPEVMVGTTWYRPLEIDGVTIGDILEYCDKKWPGGRHKRFGEDLVEALVGMGHTPSKTVALRLAPLDGGDEVVLKAVELTRAKRQALRNANERPRDPRTARKRAQPPRMLSREAALEDLAEFRSRLEEQFAYLELRGIDLPASIDAIGASLAAEVETAQLAEALSDVMLRFGDGHASVTSVHGQRPTRFLPVLLEEADGGIVAFLPDRSALVDPRRPYVRAIDGRPVADWLAALAPSVPAGSPQLVRQRTLRSLRDIDGARGRLGLDVTDDVVLTLAARPRGGKTSKKKLSLASRKPKYGAWPRAETQLLTDDAAGDVPGGVGYLRIPRMDDNLVPQLRRAMESFRATGGLIVDVRGNGGGQRGILLALAGYLLSPTEGPVVVNVAAYRLSPRFKKGHLGGSRHLYRRDDSHWNSKQRAAIDRVAARFEPEWEPPAGFSEWHYLVLDRTGHADEYEYKAPIVVLADAGCFSATDIFLGALAELPRVTLIGRASSGGSARVQTFSLRHSGIQVRCASMASFRPNGQLYDGRGIEVDVEVPPVPTDFLIDGSDAPMAAALCALAADH